MDLTDNFFKGLSWGESRSVGTFLFSGGIPKKSYCQSMVSCVLFQQKQTLFRGEEEVVEIWRKISLWKRKIQKKLHLHTTCPAAHHNIFTHLGDFTECEGEKRGSRAAQRGLRGWLLAYAQLRNTSIWEYLFIMKKYLSPSYWILSHFCTSSSCHLELSTFVKLVFPSVRLYRCLKFLNPWNYLTFPWAEG